MGTLRSGPRGGTGPWGQYKTPEGWGAIRAQRGRARSALFSRVTLKIRRSFSAFSNKDLNQKILQDHLISKPIGNRQGIQFFGVQNLIMTKQQKISPFQPSNLLTAQILEPKGPKSPYSDIWTSLGSLNP